MKEPFIFVFLDDQTLDVVSPFDDLISNYEPIDVENGVYTFFDQDFRIMQPLFTNPNKKWGIFIKSGFYKLIAGQQKKEEFLSLLNETHIVNVNDWFTSLDEIIDYAKKIE